MTSRATVQQAIELLKIHQLRRENTAIYDQIQALRDEVSKLQDANASTEEELREIRVDLQSISTLATQNNDQNQKTASILEQVVRDKDCAQSALDIVQKQNNSLCANVQTQHHQLLNRMGALETTSNNIVEKSDITHQKLCGRMDQIQEDIAKRITSQEFETLQARLQTAEKDIAAVYSKYCDTESASRVYDSIEGNIGDVGRVSSLADQVQQRNYNGEPPNTESPAQCLAHINSGGQTARNATVADDLDLDEAGTYISRGSHYLRLEAFDNSLVMLPYVAGKETNLHEQLLQDQQPRKPIAEILVPGTESVEADSGPKGGGTVKLKKEQPRLQLRRSQRLVERAQFQLLNETQVTEQLETETQAEALNVRIALASKNRDRRQRDDTVNKVSQLKRKDRTFLSNDEFDQANASKRTHLAKTTSENNAAKTPQHKRTRLEERSNMLKRLNQDPSSDPLDSRLKISSDAETELLLQRIDTPTRKIFTSKPVRELPQTPIRHVLRPLNPDKLQAQKLSLHHPVAMDFSPSPYIPQPMLVQRQKMSLQLPERSSDSDVFLPQPKKPTILEISNQQKPGRVQKSKRRLPLPPPPEIPILSTSTEEDRRFNQW